VYTSLEQNAIDGMENGIGILYKSKLMEVQNYMLITNHMESVMPIVMSVDFYNNLSSEHQKIIEEGVDISVKSARENIVKDDNEYIENMKEEGVTIIELTPENREKFVKSIEPVYDYFSEKFETGLIDIAQKYNN